MPDVAYKVFRCGRGHQWDVFGHESDGEFKEFVPDNLQLYLCPTCDGLVEEKTDPENLT